MKIMIRGLEHFSYQERLSGFVHPGEENAPGRHNCGFSILKKGL